MNVVNYKQY